MNVVALFDAGRQAWFWRIVNDAGDEIANSGAGRHYPSLAEALRAGAAHREQLGAGRPPILRKPVRVRRRA
jgi:hypothetical protein